MRRYALKSCTLFFAAVLSLAGLQAEAKGAAESRAQRQFQQKDFAAVTETLKLPLDTLSVTALKMLSRAHQELENWEDAERVLEFLKLQVPQDHLVALNLARVQLAQNKAEEGLLEYKRATSLQPQLFTAYQEQLDYFESHRRFADMRALLTDMLPHFGERKEVVLGLCKSYYEDGYVEQSKSYCQKAIQKDRQNPSAYVYLGLTHKNTGEDKEATEWIAKASSRFPASELAQWAAGELQLEKRNFLGAEKHLLLAQKSEPHSVRVLKSLAHAQFELGKYQEALMQFQKWCEVEKRVPEEFRKASGELLTEQPEWHRKYISAMATCNS